jgi:ATP-binding cassette, subfamily B, bacterial
VRTRLRVLRGFASTAPGLFAAAVVFMVAEALLPNLVLIALGRTVGGIPAAVTDGLGSPAGHRMLTRLGVAGGLYAVSLVRGPVEDALGAVVRARMTAVSQRRLIEAVSAPAGIAHLEDPAVLDRLAGAQGELTGQAPADAAMALLSRAGDRLSGVLACAVLAGFRWWLGLGVLAVWLVVNRPLRALVRSRVGTYRRATETLRRSWYFAGLARRPHAAKEIRVFGLGDWLVGRHRALNAEAMSPSWEEARRLNRRIALLGVLVLAAYGAGAATLGRAAYHHTITLGALVVLLTMLPASTQAGSITAADFALEGMLAAVPDLDALTRDLSADDEPESSVPVAGLPRERVVFSSVAFRYPGAEDDVLSGLDLTLAAGTSTAVVGVNGAGKTTLVTLLARLRDPTGGAVLVDGTPLTDLPARAWQRQVAVVYQDFTRFPLTARENVALDLLGEPVDAEALARVARRAGAASLVEGLPGGWETVLSAQYEGGQDLSGGQWQRVALARALYAVERGARILVLDEPTAQLDVRAEARFYDRFLDLTKGVTSVVISHRFSTVRRADTIAVLDGGQVTETGTHDELLRANGTYAEMFRLQVARFEERR